MGFCRKIHNYLGLLLLKQAVYTFSVADIQLHKAEIELVHDRLQSGKISCVGQGIHTDDAVFFVLL